MTAKYEIKSGSGLAEVGSSWNGSGDVVSGIASTYPVDLGGDRVVPGAYAKTIEKNPVIPMLWNHEPGNPIGKTLTLVEDPRYGLLYRAALVNILQAGDAWALCSEGIMSVSIGYNAVKSKYVQEGGERVRLLQEIELLELSLCVFPMALGTTAEVGKMAKSRDLFGAIDDALTIAELDQMGGWESLDHKAAAYAGGAMRRELERKMRHGLTDQEFFAQQRAEMAATLAELEALMPKREPVAIPTMEQLRAHSAELARLATL